VSLTLALQHLELRLRDFQLFARSLFERGPAAELAGDLEAMSERALPELGVCDGKIE
jgi:hypothetical protein